ncbi:RecB family exonuclease [Thiolapillus sp.]|uniref:RecB family exonuclease n=1 Tax=Thiolapillus sp. TaxID=2017437 RepID=UPI003AF65A10
MIYSSSRFQTWERCGAMLEARYIKGLEPEVTSANLVFGKAVHQVWAEWLLAWHEGDAYDMASAFEEEWGRRTEATAIEYNTLFDEQALLTLGKRLGKLFPEAWEKSGLVLAVDHDNQPLVERHLMAKVGGVLVQGYLDLVALDSDGNICVADVKTPSSASNEEFALEADQLTLYQILVEANQDGLDLDGPVRKLGFIEGLKRKREPKVLPPLWVPAREEPQKQRFARKIQWIDRQIQDRQFHRRSLAAFDSPCNMCDYRELCTTGSMDGLTVSQKRKQREATLAASLPLAANA